MNSYLPSTQDAGSSSRRPRLLILVGMVGSGKTTLAEAMVKTGWVRASQDDAPNKRRQECEATVRSALREGKNVIVDRVDFDPQQRVHFLGIAKEFSNVDCLCLILDAPRSVLEDRLSRRTNHPTITDPTHALQVLGRMVSSYKPPVPETPEGFRRAYTLPYAVQPEDGQWTEEMIVKILEDLQTSPDGWSDEGKEVEWNRNLPPPSSGNRGSYRGGWQGANPRPSYRPGFDPRSERPGGGFRNNYPNHNYQARPVHAFPPQAYPSNGYIPHQNGSMPPIGHSGSRSDNWRTNVNRPPPPPLQPPAP